jgi:hypothetical protein
MVGSYSNRHGPCGFPMDALLIPVSRQFYPSCSDAFTLEHQYGRGRGMDRGRERFGGDVDNVGAEAEGRVLLIVRTGSRAITPRGSRASTFPPLKGYCSMTRLIPTVLVVAMLSVAGCADLSQTELRTFICY